MVFHTSVTAEQFWILRVLTKVIKGKVATENLIKRGGQFCNIKKLTK
jgi:hypothetical protein